MLYGMDIGSSKKAVRRGGNREKDKEPSQPIREVSANIAPEGISTDHLFLSKIADALPNIKAMKSAAIMDVISKRNAEHSLSHGYL